MWCVGGVTVSIVAFQAIDPGSTPGQRKFFPTKVEIFTFSFIFIFHNLDRIHQSILRCSRTLHERILPAGASHAEPLPQTRLSVAKVILQLSYPHTQYMSANQMLWRLSLVMCRSALLSFILSLLYLRFHATVSASLSRHKVSGCGLLVQISMVTVSMVA